MTTALLDNEAVHVHKLANGMTVTLERLPYLYSASIGVWVKAGSGSEEAYEAGLAHFLEHLFFKGTTNRSVHELMEAIEGRGGQINAFTAREYTCLYVKVLDKHVRIGIEILGDILKNALFADLEKEKNVVLEEIASVEDTPDEYVYDLLSEFHWPDHALGRSISGTHDSVSALTRDHVLAFFQKWYRPENLYVSIAGNFDEDEVLAQLRDEFEGISTAPAPPHFLPPSFHAGVQIHPRDIAQAHLTLAFPAPTQDEDERFVCDLAGNILGGGSTSRLFEKIREERGLAYAVQTFHAFHKTAGMMGVYAAIAPQNYGDTLELACAELRRIRDEVVPAEELEMNREQVKGGMMMAMENPFTRMARMAKSMMYFGRIISLDEAIGRIDAVTAEHIQAYCRKAFRPDNAALVVLGPTGKYKHNGIPL